MRIEGGCSFRLVFNKKEGASRRGCASRQLFNKKRSVKRRWFTLVNCFIKGN